jgi:hypothetical protein
VVVVVWTGVVFLVVAAFFVVAVVVVLGVVGVVVEAFLCELELPQPAIAAAAVIASRARFISTPPGSFGRLGSADGTQCRPRRRREATWPFCTIAPL